MPKKKEYMQIGTGRLNRLETIKEFMVAELSSADLSSMTYKEAADNAYTQAVACWEILCENEGGE